MLKRTDKKLCATCVFGIKKIDCLGELTEHYLGRLTEHCFLSIVLPGKKFRLPLQKRVHPRKKHKKRHMNPWGLQRVKIVQQAKRKKKRPETHHAPDVPGTNCILTKY